MNNDKTGGDQHHGHKKIRGYGLTQEQVAETNTGDGHDKNKGIKRRGAVFL